MCLSLVAFVTFVFATPTALELNVTIAATHPSIIFWPPESWSSITTDRHTNGSIQHPLHSLPCLQRDTTYRLAYLNNSEQNGERQLTSTKTIRTSDDTARHSNQAPDENDDWRISIQTSCNCHQRMNSGCSCSEAIVTDASEIIGPCPMTLRLKFIGELPRYCPSSMYSILVMMFT
jgi:hypothetical protein